MVLNYKGRQVIDNRTSTNYLQCAQSRIEHAASELPNPAHLEGSYDLSRLKNRMLPHVTECLLTRLSVKLLKLSLTMWLNKNIFGCGF